MKLKLITQKNKKIKNLDLFSNGTMAFESTANAPIDVQARRDPPGITAARVLAHRSHHQTGHEGNRGD